MPHELSPTLPLCNDIELNIAAAFEFFSTQLNNPSQKLCLFGKQVYYEAYEMVDNKIVGFWHLISTAMTSLSVLPCNNDVSFEYCDENCIKLLRLVEIKNKGETRAICLYRLSHLPWIMDVIKLANDKSSFVACWVEKGDHNRSKLYVRYKKGTADYVLIFSNEKKYYRLLTAYPVFMVRDRKKFDQNHISNAWIYKQ